MKSAAIVVFLAGCTAAHTAANSAYTGQLLECVDKSKTKEESQACRESVNQRWGLVNLDASTGGDAGK